MKISDIIKEKGFAASLEVFPPKNDLKIDTAKYTKARFHKCNLWCWWNYPVRQYSKALRTYKGKL